MKSMSWKTGSGHSMSGAACTGVGWKGKEGSCAGSMMAGVAHRQRELAVEVYGREAAAVGHGGSESVPSVRDGNGA